MPRVSPLLDVELRPGRPAVLHTGPVADPAAWAGEHRDALRDVVAAHGSVLVRGLGLDERAAAGAVFAAIGDGPVAEREPFAQRRALGGDVWSATHWPETEPMCHHHEQSYVAEFPGLMQFACLTAPADNGATTVADAAAVLDALPADLVARVEREGWQLVRSYNDEIGASWQQAFGTDDTGAVERYCAANGIMAEWTADGGLRTRQRRDGVVTHPASGRRCWFNQIAFLSEWTMDPDVREFLLEDYGPDGLPFTTRFGGGEPVGADVVETVNAVYRQLSVREPWQDGDLLVVDNVRAAHARETFSGPRGIVVGMTDPMTVTEATARAVAR